MDKDKLSNEDYFKAVVAELLNKYGVTDHARVKGLKIDLYGLHDEVINRVDPTEPLPFPNIKTGDYECDGCGCHPNSICITDKGRFCLECYGKINTY